MMLLGAVAFFLGLVALWHTVTTSLVSTFLLGMMLMLIGLIRVWDLSFGSGTLYFLGGLVLVLNPVAATLSIGLLLAVVLIGLGFVRLISDPRADGPTALASKVAGGLSILLGVILLTGWPFSGFWAVGMFVAADLILVGLTAVSRGWNLMDPLPQAA